LHLSGERLTDAECEEVLKDCMDPEDDDGFIPYARKYRFVLGRVSWMRLPPPPRWTKNVKSSASHW